MQNDLHDHDSLGAASQDELSAATDVEIVRVG